MKHFLRSIACFSSVVAASALGVSSAVAQEVDPEVAEFVDFVNGTINQVINAATLFTSQESVSSGYFKFKSKEDPDTKLDVMRLPGRLNLCDDENNPIMPYIRGQIGLLKVTESIRPFDDSEGVNDFSTINTMTAEVGGGVDVTLVEGLVLSPEFSFAYSHVKNNYDYNNAASQFFAPFLDKQVFNWDLDVMTYSPRVKLVYTLPFEWATFKASSRYAYLYNDSFSSSSDIIDISSDTSLIQNGVEAKVPLGFSVFESAVALRPFFVRSDVHGAARRGLGFDHFYEGGLDLAFATKDSLGVLSEVSIGTSYTFGSDFEGWRFGLGFSL